MNDHQLPVSPCWSIPCWAIDHLTEAPGRFDEPAVHGSNGNIFELPPIADCAFAL
jgi:hypothetical protein